ncbi:MAG: bifunctional 3-deoxy-7-phosphoheptulonate synthase/chorismate mutase, partial [Pseudomonadota bacterium]
QLREQTEKINYSILEMLNTRAGLVEKIRSIKKTVNLPLHDPDRERLMLEDLVDRNAGPFEDETIVKIFNEIFHASLGHMEESSRKRMLVSRSSGAPSVRFPVGAAMVGDRSLVIAGPCAVESETQMEKVAAGLSRMGISIIRGGAFKPRTSPYSFQGLGEKGLRIMRAAADRHGLAIVTEVMDTRMVETVARYADILQIGARNMYNYDLLKEAGRVGKPVFLKRGLSATIDEFLWSAEYIALEGEKRIILCDRGVRTFERETRNTLDISSVPLLRNMTPLPVFVDISHAAGRRDILTALARAALAAGAQGLMVEVHPCPAVALSDSGQQLSLDAFRDLLGDLTSSGLLEICNNRKKARQAARGAAAV